MIKLPVYSEIDSVEMDYWAVQELGQNCEPFRSEDYACKFNGFEIWYFYDNNTLTCELIYPDGSWQRFCLEGFDYQNQETIDEIKKTVGDGL